MPDCTHVIFDLDGLLLDTEELYSQAYQKVLSSFGDHTYTFDFKTRLMGRSEPDCARAVVEGYNLAVSPDLFLERLVEEQDKILENTHWMPGTIRLLHHLYKHGIPMAVATSSAERVYNVKMFKHKRFLSFFSHVVKGSDEAVKRGKPHPDIYLVAAALFKDNPDPARCLAFEDAPHGVRSARAAGMRSVMIPDQRLGNDLRLDAELVLETAWEFRPEEFGLPPFNYKKVTHVIFDVDGLLLDSGKIYLSAMHQILAKFGRSLDLDHHRSTVGRRHLDNVPSIIKHYNLPVDDERFMEEYRKVVVPMFAAAEPKEGALELVTHLFNSGIAMAVATSSTSEGYEEKTKRHKESIFGKFAHIVTGSDKELDRGKPAPDIFLLACSRFNPPPVSPGDCLVFEDAVSGVAAAARAGMQSVLVPDGSDSVDPEDTKDATVMITTLRDFRPQLFGLPPFPGSP